MTEDSVRIRTRPSLVRNLLLSAIIGGIPLFGVLFWLSITQGNWQSVLVAFGVFLAGVFFATWRHHAVFVDVTSTTITEQSVFRRRAIPVSDVASITLAHTYRGSSPETLPQLVAKGADGTVLLRLRGVFWSEEDMAKVADAIGARVNALAEPMSLREFYAQNPGVAYWYEGRPWIGVIGITLGFIATLAIVWWLMTAIGVAPATG